MPRVVRVSRCAPERSWTQVSHWLTWVQERSGAQRETLTTLGNQNYPPMEAAPGTYVRVR